MNALTSRTSLRAAISGTLSGLVLVYFGPLVGGPRVLEDLLWYSPGLVFGVFVVAPACSSTPQLHLRRAILACWSAAAYFAAVLVATNTYEELTIPGACALAGLAGAALVTLLPAAMNVVRPAPVRLLRAGLLAPSAGALIGLGMDHGDWYEPATLVGYFLWQWGIGVSLFAPREQLGG